MLLPSLSKLDNGMIKILHKAFNQARKPLIWFGNQDQEDGRPQLLRDYIEDDTMPNVDIRIIDCITFLLPDAFVYAIPRLLVKTMVFNDIDLIDELLSYQLSPNSLQFMDRVKRMTDAQILAIFIYLYHLSATRSSLYYHTFLKADDGLELMHAWQSIFISQVLPTKL